MVAQHHKSFFRIEFLVCPGRNVAHRHQHRAIDSSGFKLPWLANVNQFRLVFFQQCSGFGRGNLVVQHHSSLKVSHPRTSNGLPFD